MTVSKLCTKNKNRKRSFKPSTRVQQGRRNSYSGVMTRPEFGNFGDEGWLCTFVYCATSSSIWNLPEAHAAEKLLSGQAVRYKSHLPGHSLQLSWAGRRVGSVLYAFRPLWVHSSAVSGQYRVEIFKKVNNLFYKR